MLILSQHKQAIEKWITTIVRDGGIDRFDDLHIDRIDANWKNRTLWIDGGFASISIAAELINLYHFEFTPILRLSLESGENLRGVDFQTQNALSTQLDWILPSLYLFRRGEEPWIQIKQRRNTELLNGKALCEKLDPIAFGLSLVGSVCYYTESQDPESGEYLRNLYFGYCINTSH